MSDQSRGKGEKAGIDTGKPAGLPGYGLKENGKPRAAFSVLELADGGELPPR